MPTDAYGEPMLPLPDESEPVGEAYRSQSKVAGVVGGELTGCVTAGGVVVIGAVDVGGVVVTGCVTVGGVTGGVTGVAAGGVTGGVVTTGSGVMTGVGVTGCGEGLGAGLVVR